MSTSRVKTGAIQVEGLRELGKALTELGPDFRRELRETNKDVATMIASKARGAGFSVGGVAAKTAPDVKASAGLTSAGVSLGSAPYAAGAEFGGQGRPTTQQFQPWRGSGSGAGYFVYPTIRSNAQQIEDDYVDAVNKVIERNFPQ